MEKMYNLADGMGGGLGANPLSSETPLPNGPMLYISGKTEMEIPEEGVAMIKFRKIRSTETEDSRDGERYSYELEVQEIGCFGKSGSKKMSKYEEGKSALDRLAKKKMESEDEEDDD